MSSRQEQKAAARAAREQAEREAAAAAKRRRTLSLIGAIAVAAVVVVLVVVLAGGDDGGGSGGKVEAGKAAPGGPETEELLGGIPQDGFSLGRKDAPLTMIEFADMQCPVCKDYDANVFATLVDKYVRPGKMRMEMRLQSFLGPDSVTAGKAVAAAAEQDKAWTFAHLFYVNQGQENTGYVTDDYLRSVASAAQGLDVDKLMEDRNKAAAQTALDNGSQEFQAAGFTGTPSFLLGSTGGDLQPLEFEALEPDQFTKKIDEALKTAK